jgi:hypothetical protein
MQLYNSSALEQMATFKLSITHLNAADTLDS